MKTIRLLYPDYLSGGLDTYYLGAHLLQHLLPENKNQPLIKVNVLPPDGQEKPVTQGITGEAEILASIQDAQKKIASEQPDRIITLGGNCLVSLAPFDYLHGKKKNTGIIWLDAHPDVSTPEDKYPFAHAMVLGSLLGGGSPVLRQQLKNGSFQPDQLLYIGLQPLHDYQEKFLKETGVSFTIQDQKILGDAEIKNFIQQFDQILVHFDIDALDEHFFFDTYFANPALTGDGSGGGKMTLAQVLHILQLIETNSQIAGLTIAEYLPFSAQQLQKMFSQLTLLTE